jgi:hypothetical protein
MPSKNPEVLARAQKKWREKNPNYLREWRAANPEKTAEYNEGAYERRKSQYREYYHRNKSKIKEYQQRQRKLFPEGYYERQLKRRIGKTLADKQLLFDSQQGKCAICEIGIELLASHYDHIHHTKPVVTRGLLCGTCNRALGFFKDDPALLERAAAYIRTFQK